MRRRELVVVKRRPAKEEAEAVEERLPDQVEVVEEPEYLCGCLRV